MTVSTWTFPHATCEMPNEWTSRLLGMSQPFSVAANLFIVGVATMYSCSCRTARSRWFFTTVVLFEIAHTLSHARHVDARMQETIVHLLAYVFSRAFYDVASPYLPKERRHIAAAFAIDVALFTQRFDTALQVTTVPSIVPVVSLLMSTATILLSMRVPATVRKHGVRVFCSLVALIVCLGIEAAFCEDYMRIAPLPYHLFVEMCSYRLIASVYVFVSELDAVMLHNR